MITESFPTLTERDIDLCAAGARFAGRPPPGLTARVQLGGPLFVAIDAR